MLSTIAPVGGWPSAIEAGQFQHFNYSNYWLTAKDPSLVQALWVSVQVMDPIVR